MKAKKKAQLGFTLIELMVVVVIVAVLLTSVTLSLQPNDDKRLLLAAEKVRGYLQQSCDEAVLTRQVVLSVPSEKGLQRYELPNPLKLPENNASNAKVEVKGKALSWSEGVSVSWEGTVLPRIIANESEDTATLRLKGWRCWPTGEMDKGSIQFQQTAEDKKSLGVHLSWDSWGHFNVQ